MPNLRQVHLIHIELLDELAAKGFAIAPGAMGENVTTRGIDLLALAKGTKLRLGREAVIEITGLRNPCHQLNSLAVGLMSAVLDRAEDGSLIRKCGVMAVVVLGERLFWGMGLKLLECRSGMRSWGRCESGSLRPMAVIARSGL